MSALTAVLGQARAELAGNLRLRYGVWLVVAILLAYLALAQNDRAQAAFASYVAEANRLSRTASLLEREDWPQLLAAERETHGRLAALTWQAESEGIAQAELQNEVRRMVEATQLNNVIIRTGVSQQVPGLPAVWRIQMRVTGGYAQGAELQLLHAVATHPKRLVVDRLDITRTNVRLTLMVSAYFVGFASEQGAEQ